MRNIGVWIVTMALVIAINLLTALCADSVITSIASNAAVLGKRTVVIDAGHGGEDGGAVSCTGVAESMINLEISERLRDLMNLLGIPTVMTRTGDYSVYVEGKTLAEKKVSDLNERVRMVREVNEPILISIHQNFFSESRYSGAQVFYAKTEESELLASQLQQKLVSVINPGSNRREKAAQHIYLLESVTCDAVLIECGFLSNPQEENQLRDESYQKKLCCVIAVTACDFMNTSPPLA